MQVNLPRTNRHKQNLAPPKLRSLIPCGYCFQEWASGYDHIIPWIAGGTNDPNNLHPSCLRCNLLLGSTIFNSLKEKKEYVRNKLIDSREWIMPDMPENILEEEASNILQSEMQVGSLAEETDRKCKRCEVSLTKITEKYFYAQSIKFCSIYCRDEYRKVVRREEKILIRKLWKVFFMLVNLVGCCGEHDIRKFPVLFIIS